MSLQSKRWLARPHSYAVAARLGDELGVSPVIAAVLARRGHSTPEQARSFLAADDRHDPFLFAGMRDACDSILGHLERGSRVVVHGDYDVDGVCSTAILLNALRALGGDPGWHIPSRADEGYGLSMATVERLAGQGTGLLITADCAITAVEEVEEAQRRGIDVVVTDHHRPAERLPACPIVHPSVSGYPFEGLCAAGVAHKLSQALHTAAGEDPARADADIDLVALATICDVVPLRDENRRLAREGLHALGRTSKVGLRALMRVAGVDPAAVGAHDAGFRLGPRLNAAGRLARADAALELLLTHDETRATEVADELDLLNRERRDTETRIAFEAEAARAAQAHEPAYVLAGEGWHPGVIGIVASRMVERHCRPCAVVALEDGAGRGSARSIGAFDLHAGLAACAGHLTRFGGHRAAAGFELEAAALEPFRRAFAHHAASVLSPEDLRPLERVDALVPGDALGMELAEELERLGPFGQGNPCPTLLVPAARLGGVAAMGEDGQHARLTVRGGGAIARAVAFRTTAASLAAARDAPHDVAVRLELNEWNGTVEPRLIVRGMCPTEPGRFEELGAEPFWEAVERELRGAPPEPALAPASRRIRERRGEGFAGVAGELIATGESVAVVCADLARRRATLESLIGGLAAGVDVEGGAPRPGILEWDALARDPGLARPYAHLVALDPPAEPGGRELLAAAPGPGDAAFAHLAWGPAEVEFALAVARDRFELRPALEDFYTALRDRGTLSGAELETALRGQGRHPRPATVCGRMLCVLTQLRLAEYDAAERSCRALPAARTSLELSPAYRLCAERLAEATALLHAEQAQPGAARAAR